MRKETAFTTTFSHEHLKGCAMLLTESLPVHKRLGKNNQTLLLLGLAAH